jgi:PAS domain S-box-containing protein
LEGLEEQWNERDSSQRLVTYTTLPPGEYVFSVKASNSLGIWNENGIRVQIRILPPWWNTNWFRFLFVAAFTALLWGLYQLRVRQLRRQERKLRDVIETIPTIAWTALPDGSVDFVNCHWQEYTGLSTEQTAGSGWETAAHPEDVKRYAEKWRTAVGSGEPFENEVRFRRAADAQYRWFLTRAVPLRDARGKILKWYGTTIDIEDREHAKQLQADLAHINRVTTMGELTSSLAHELKQPIAATVINANACIRWLKREKPDLEEACAATSRIVEEQNRAADLIDHLRSLYTKSPPKRELVEVSGIVHEMVVLLRGEAYRYAVSTRTDLAADLPRITADRVQLQQVLMNLMLNAIEAMKETGGVLTVKSQRNGDNQLLISVSDTGVGLPAEKADQIFDAFFTTKTQGSGMGLAISRSIIESHGGRLWATANDGRGATFYFSLRAAAEEVKVPAVVT